MSKIEFNVLISGESRNLLADNIVEAAELAVEDYEFRHANFPVAAGTDDAIVRVTTPSGDTRNFVVSGRLVPLYTAKESDNPWEATAIVGMAERSRLEQFGI